MSTVIVKVPASTANLGSGFDTIGMALSLYTTITIASADKLDIQVLDKRLNTLQVPENNLVYQGAKKVLEKAGRENFPLKITIASDIPLKRGLGSSGAAVVGGMIGVNALLDSPFSKEEIFQMATQLEGHPDNVAASLFGGIIITTKVADGNYTYLKLDPPQGLKAVVGIPDLHLATQSMRDVLPASYPKEDTIFAVNHTALLVGALATGKLEYLYEAMQDRLHQPYRARFVPCLDRLILEGKDHGALGVALSGAGPSLIAFTKDTEEELVTYMREMYDEENISAEIRILTIDPHGVQVERTN